MSAYLFSSSLMHCGYCKRGRTTPGRVVGFAAAQLKLNSVDGKGGYDFLSPTTLANYDSEANYGFVDGSVSTSEFGDLYRANDPENFEYEDVGSIIPIVSDASYFLRNRFNPLIAF